MIDLHSHSTASDGQYSPSELIEKAYKRGLSVIALTDHDTIKGLEEAEKKAKELSITFVPGIEINIHRPGSEFHLLGLGINRQSNSLLKLTEKLKQNRLERNIQIIQKLNENGINISLEEIKKEYPRESLGRPQIAEFLYTHGFVKNVQQAFDKFLTRGKSCFIEKKGCDLSEAVTAIYESQGIPVIAHPLSLYLSWSKLEETLKNFRNQAVLGLEAYHPGARVVECERLEEIARRNGFFVTAGSDFHGEKIRRDRYLGLTCGQRRIDDRFYTDELLVELEKRR